MNKLQYKLISSPPLSRIFKTAWIGEYSSYQQAVAAIPKGNGVGYNQQSAYDRFKTYPVMLKRPADYAATLHLKLRLEPNMRVVDLGGSVGMAMYIAQSYFPLPTGITWTVSDVPPMLRAAREIALQKGDEAAPLRFVESLAEAGPCDLFFSSGALQYIESPLPELLKQFPQLPRVVLLNRIPLWDRPQLYCVQDSGFFLSPYTIFNRQRLLSGLLDLGYTRQDSWTCPESGFSVRFKPWIRLTAYDGLLLTRP